MSTITTTTDIKQTLVYWNQRVLSTFFQSNDNKIYILPSKLHQNIKHYIKNRNKIEVSQRLYLFEHLSAKCAFKVSLKLLFYLTPRVQILQECCNLFSSVFRKPASAFKIILYFDSAILVRWEHFQEKQLQ